MSLTSYLPRPWTAVIVIKQLSGWPLPQVLSHCCRKQWGRAPTSSVLMGSWTLLDVGCRAHAFAHTSLAVQILAVLLKAAICRSK